MIKFDFHPPQKTLRQFGWIALVGFPVLGLVAHFGWGAPAWALYGLTGFGVLHGLLALLALEALLLPVFVLMELIAIPIGILISSVLLGLLFYLLVTPVGWYFRLTGKDPMQRTWDRNARTYWHARTVKRTPASYLRLH